jgi:hypothetical protein
VLAPGTGIARFLDGLPDDAGDGYDTARETA